MSDTTTTDQPEASGQAFYVGTQQLLCGLAMIVFAVYFWSRGLTWSNYEIIVKSTAATSPHSVAKSIPVQGSDWNRADTTMVICAGVVFAINLIYIFFSRVTDQFVPAIANIATGAVLTIVTLYFIHSPNGALGTATSSKNLVFTNKVASGAYVSLGIAIVLIAVGVLQMVVRGKAQAETEAAKQ